MTKRRQSRPGRHSRSAEGGNRAPAASRWGGWLLLVGLAACMGVAGVLAVQSHWSTNGSPPQPARAPQQGKSKGEEQAAAPSQSAGEAAEAESAASDPLLQATVEELKKKELAIVQRVLRQFPESAEAVSVAGMVYNSQGNSAEAIKHWQRALQMDPRCAGAYHGMGWVAFLKADYAGAAADWSKALRINPTMPGVRNALARALLNQSQAKEAIALLEEGMTLRAAKSPTGSEDHFLLGQAHLQLKEYEEAKRNYEAALAIDPEYKQPYYGLATVYARLGQKPKAQECVEKFRKLRSKYLDELIDRSGSFDDQEAMRRSLAKTYADAGRLYARGGFLFEAETHWRQGAVLDPRSTDCRLELASLYQQANREAEALRMCAELCRIEPHNPLHYLRLGTLQQRLQQFDAAAVAFRKVVELAPRRAQGYCALAQLALATGRNLAEARAMAAKAIELEPDNAQYRQLQELVREKR